MNRLMKITALMLVAFSTVLVAQTNTESPKLSITITPVIAVVNLGSDVAIRITITNLSMDTITFPFRGIHGTIPDGFQYDVRDENGEPVIKHGKRYVQLPNGNKLQLPSRLSGSTMMNGAIQISPEKSEEIASNARISEIYPFDHLGKYTIQISRILPGMPVVYSNTITVTVVAPDPASETPK